MNTFLNDLDEKLQGGGRFVDGDIDFIVLNPKDYMEYALHHFRKENFYPHTLSFVVKHGFMGTWTDTTKGIAVAIWIQKTVDRGQILTGKGLPSWVQKTEVQNAEEAPPVQILGYDIVATPDDASIMRSECGTISLKHRKADGWGDEQWALDVHVNAHFHVTTYGATSKEVEEKAACIIEDTKQDCIVTLREYGEYA